jgi:deoxycytidine triphosphate deaminase
MISSLKLQTSGSTTFDFSCPNDIDIYPNQCPFKLSTNIYGPIPDGTVGLFLGQSRLTRKGVTLHTGIIDSDYKEELNLMVSVSSPWSLKKGQHIAHLLLLPYIGIFKSSNVMHGGFGSIISKLIIQH